ncbi:hypothetical protein EHI8A_173350 [Entamoeba histolytica HM-1:IMSS-B]|uniref:Uncharacterized protein n=6 Tax=Entamoeba histolytica TaxID=5759 RepID=C4MBG6_ENTH1|nr:hypothetical protein EHI_147240 [Entamoeba histolytica HM-1:IMSS]EMD46300.1 Hypothetical protein EHI5A_156750 [Entamoeba histolytica KU27]EMH77997.1 hypothetical protein EHI8A_173350 [Entamoeba histolytica HM-1:IMSS-B]EMS10991.1 hypothetical protein KM1_205720 [Entamoeba histolytica HM-3:IMSS]ENY63695.1 hypothetical protein EHI7A_116140 [Entamoeba histolytica HM-1:IMSS-A]GAT99338.1 hypothetical protein CL6EHI_147240 [Entamoeba histolytica]|eukprot:XP_649675.1 hypothetical protein EHI_147240 [Entamoeba histolytica HM-1:IMSS]
MSLSIKNKGKELSLEELQKKREELSNQITLIENEINSKEKEKTTLIESRIKVETEIYKSQLYQRIINEDELEREVNSLKGLQEMDKYNSKLNEQMNELKDQYSNSNYLLEKFRKDKDISENLLKKKIEECDFFIRRFDEQAQIVSYQEVYLKHLNFIKQLLIKRMNLPKKTIIESVIITRIIKYMGVADELKKVMLISKRFQQAVLARHVNFYFSSEKREFMRELLLFPVIRELTCDNYFLDTFSSEDKGKDILERIKNVETLHLRVTTSFNFNFRKILPKAEVVDLTISMQHYSRGCISGNVKLKILRLDLQHDFYNNHLLSAIKELESLELLEKVIIKAPLSDITSKLKELKMKSNPEFVLKAMTVNENTIKELRTIETEKITVCVCDEIVDISVLPYITRDKVVEGKNQLRFVLTPTGLFQFAANETLLNKTIIEKMLPKSVVVSTRKPEEKRINYISGYVDYDWDSLVSISFNKINFTEIFPRLGDNLELVNFVECVFPESLSFPKKLNALTLQRCAGVKIIHLPNSVKIVSLKQIPSLECVCFDTKDMNIPLLKNLVFEGCPVLGKTALPYSLTTLNVMDCKNFKIVNCSKIKLFNTSIWEYLLKYGIVD